MAVGQIADRPLPKNISRYAHESANMMYSLKKEQDNAFITKEHN